MTWWHYLLLVNFYLVLFFGFYALLLRRETFFQLNRVYLVSAALLSFLIPLIQSNWVKNLFVTQEIQHTIYNSPVVIYNYTFAPAAAQSALTVGQVLNALYIAVTLCLILRLMWQLIILKKAIEKPSPSAAYSFFKKISVGNKLEHGDVIHAHEQVHARQWHSVDVLIIETVMIINWFNPVVYLYRFAIKYIHEFIADRQVIQSGTNEADYALLLLSQNFDVPTHQLVTPFYNNSLLKKRITMLQKNRSQRIALAKYGLSAPLFILMLILSSATVNNSKAVNAINEKRETIFSTSTDEALSTITDHGEIPEGKVELSLNDTTPKSKVYNQVEKQPEFPGGFGEFGKFLAKNIHYPADDKKNNIQGKVIVQFIVERDGSLTGIRALRGPSESMSAEAVRVLSSSPKWTPGFQNTKAVRVMFTVPVAFTLNPADNDASPANKQIRIDAPQGNPGGLNPDGTYSSVEKQPEFPGGIQGFGEFLAHNVRYPAVDRQNNVQGKVILQFVVEADGSLSDIKALRGPSQTEMDESVRAISLSPKWEPGILNGKPVRVRYTVPVNFTLNRPIPNSKADTMLNGRKSGSVIVPNGQFIDVRGFSSVSTSPEDGPLFIIDGEPKTKADFAKIDPNKIITFSILKDANAAVYSDNPKAKNGVIFVNTRDADNLLYVIDGVVKNQTEFIDLKPFSINSISVLKGEPAIALYGQKGAKGVIVITTKKNAAVNIK